MKTYPTHELARLLPPMTDEDFQRLKQDVKDNGLREPITLHEDKVLDGVHRQRACRETRTEPRYVTYDGDDPAGLAYSRNLARRHLSVSQRAMVAAELIPRFAGQRGRPNNSSKSRQIISDAAKRAAEVAGVSRASVANAQRVKREAPDLVKDIKAGKTTIGAATEEVKRRAKSWNGKTNPMREREIKAQRKTNKKTGNYNELLRLSLEMNRVCTIIEAYKVDDFELDVATLDLIDDFHDDLITLATWTDRALVATQGWLSSLDVRKKIDALRLKTVANGATPEEAESAQRVADKLERKLELVLPA